MIDNLKSTVIANGQKYQNVKTTIRVGGQCCYKDGPSGLLTVDIAQGSIEIILTEEDIENLINSLQTSAMSWVNKAKRKMINKSLQ